MEVVDERVIANNEERRNLGTTIIASSKSNETNDSENNYSSDSLTRVNDSMRSNSPSLADGQVGQPGTVIINDLISSIGRDHQTQVGLAS